MSLERRDSWTPDSSSGWKNSSFLWLRSLWNKLGLFSAKESCAFGNSVNRWTCWRQTCTASWTRTKYHSFPIRSTTPALARVSRTSRLGLEMASCNTTHVIVRLESRFGMHICTVLAKERHSQPECLAIYIPDGALSELEQHWNLYT